MLKILPIDKLVSDINIRNEHDESLKELVDSIKANGLISPISVREIGKGKYQIIAGHRRYEALKLIGEPLIECNILENVETTLDVYKAQLAENAQRKDMTCLEYVELFDKLKKEFNMSNTRLALFLNKSAPWIAQQYDAVKILNQTYGDNIPRDVVRKSAASIKKSYYDNTSNKKIFDGEGFACTYKNHKYNISCTDFEFEIKLQNFLRENGAKIM